jgi:hypothetical protein
VLLPAAVLACLQEEVEARGEEEDRLFPALGEAAEEVVEEAASWRTCALVSPSVGGFVSSAGAGPRSLLVANPVISAVESGVELPSSSIRVWIKLLTCSRLKSDLHA